MRTPDLITRIDRWNPPRPALHQFVAFVFCYAAASGFALNNQPLYGGLFAALGLVSLSESFRLLHKAKRHAALTATAREVIEGDVVSAGHGGGA